MAAPVSKWKKQEILEACANLIMDGKRRLKTDEEWSKDFGVSRPTMNKYFRESYALVPQEDVNQVAKRFNGLFTEAEKQVTQLIHEANKTNDEEQKRRNIKLLNEFVSAKTDFLERFGIKEKVADKVEISDERQLIVDTHAIDAEVTEK